MGHERTEIPDPLRSMATSLHAATAEAAAVVSAVEQFLGDELCIGVSGASRPFESQRAIGEDERERLVTSHLAFGRVAGRDRIYVLKATLEKAEWKEHFTQVVAEERTPWNACPREVKLQSFALLPELLGNLAARVEEVASQTTRTVHAVRDLLDAMRQVGPPPIPSHVAVAAAPIPRAPEPRPEPTPAPESPATDEALSLHDLSASSVPDLFKRPRPRSPMKESVA